LDCLPLSLDIVNLLHIQQFADWPCLLGHALHLRANGPWPGVPHVVDRDGVGCEAREVRLLFESKKDECLPSSRWSQLAGTAGGGSSSGNSQLRLQVMDAGRGDRER